MYKGTSFVLFLGYCNLCSKTFSFNSSQNIMKISIDWGIVCISVAISILSPRILSIFRDGCMEIPELQAILEKLFLSLF